MATKVDEAIVEIDLALVSIAPELEGLRDYNRLDLPPPVKAVITFAISEFERRLQKLTDVKNTLKALVEDGYPEMEIREVEDTVYTSLKQNRDTIDAALAKFASNQAVDLHLAEKGKNPK